MNIGFIGLGDMGGAIAMRLADRHNAMAVLDLRAEIVKPFEACGARICRTPAEVARASEILFTCLPGPREMREVALGSDGIFAGLHPGLTYVDLTTNSPDLICEVAEVFARSGVDMVDAPVSGGAVGARAGKLAVFVGGSQSVFDRIMPVLCQFGDEKIRHCGPLGSGNLVKLCNNLINNVHKCLLPETFALGVKAGASAQELFDAFAAGTGNCTMLHLAAKGALSGPVTGGFAGVAVKDVGLAINLAQRWGVHTPIGKAVLIRLEESLARGYGLDLWRMLEDDADVRLSFSAPAMGMRYASQKTGDAIRYCNALLSAAMLVMNPESFAIGIRGGVPQRTLFEGIRGGTGGNAMLEQYFRMLLEARAHGLEPQASSLPRVDIDEVRQALELATTLNVPMPIGSAVLTRMTEVAAGGHDSKIHLAVENESGVRFGFDPQ